MKQVDQSCEDCRFWRRSVLENANKTASFGDCVIYLKQFSLQNLDHQTVNPLLFPHDYYCSDWEKRKQ